MLSYIIIFKHLQTFSTIFVVTYSIIIALNELHVHEHA